MTHEHIDHQLVSAEPQTIADEYVGRHDAYWHRDAEAALIEVAQYIDPATERPVLEIPIDALARQVAEQAQLRGRPLFPKVALRRAQDRLLQYRLDPELRIGDVSLDFNPEVPGKPMLWGHPEALQIAFVSLTPGSWLTLGPAGEHKYEAMAIAYQPDPAVTWFHAKSGTQRADSKVHSGYLGIVHRISDVESAAEDLEQLREAVRTIATPVSSDGDPDELHVADREAAEHELAMRAMLANQPEF